ncbi:MAG: hypothetical protein AAF182_00675 [Pseudomonadota bacterium]
MGGLTSRPKVPTSQPVQIVSAPTSSALAPTSTSSEGDNESAQAVQEQRRKSLLGRDRGRLGTIQTSFRGLLLSGNQNEKRKSLLGE